jgi:hypothetical protein
VPSSASLLPPQSKPCGRNSAMTPAPKRRGFQFSLAMLLMATALVAALSWAYVEHQRAVAESAKAKSLEVEKAALQNQVKILEYQKADLLGALELRSRQGGITRLPRSDDSPPSTQEPTAPRNLVP